ncbi:MAG: hypothetical protein VX367_10375, partial [SAR324 cluster bacterium]|nr:hypothetical protein [SAR324 cluster bacterium]
TENATSTRPTFIQRKLKSIIETDSGKDAPSKKKQLTTRAKRFIEQNAANVKDFNAQQLDRLYDRLGFR